MIEMPTPASRHDFVLDECVDSGAVGDPKQSLGKAHHSDPLVGGKPVFRKKGLQQVGGFLCTDLLHQTQRAALYLGLENGAGFPALKQHMDAGRLALVPCCVDCLPGLV